MHSIKWKSLKHKGVPLAEHVQRWNIQLFQQVLNYTGQSDHFNIQFQSKHPISSKASSDPPTENLEGNYFQKMIFWQQVYDSAERILIRMSDFACKHIKNAIYR